MRRRNLADLRRLTAALALGALAATSCWTPRTRVLHTPVVAGRVIDHETHEPVVGAEVFVYRYALTEAFPEHRTNKPGSGSKSG